VERFSEFGSATVGASGSTLANVFENIATPLCRLRLYDILVGAGAATADSTSLFIVARTTAQGTAGASYTPNNLDNGGPAGQASAGQGTFSGEPTYTSNKQLLSFACHQRNTVRWVCPEGSELIVPATQNNGLGLKSTGGTSTAVYTAGLLHKE
jgi:hypothetical protein